MNEFASLGEHHQWIEPVDLRQLSLRLAGTPLGPLHKRTGFPDRELAAVVGGTDQLAEVERVRAAEPTTSVPACVDGRRACPPEDCGGTWGYRELVEILADPAHPEHDERMEWIGRPFDPESFDASEFEENLRNQNRGRGGT